MKNTHLTNQSSILFALLIVGVASLFFSCEKPEKSISFEEESHESKLKPNEWQFRQRAYPIGKIDQNAYFDALAYRQDRIAQQSLLRDGQFDTPWEFSGPTNVGGRITDIELTAGNPSIIWAGAASGGIFKSEDDGVTWLPVFDEAMSLSIGDFDISNSNEDIIYVGTGESNAGGGSLAYDGNGIYKSVDGGENWAHLGLDSIGSVGKVIVHPDDSNKCFVAAMGYLFENNNNRGVFRTSDGGNSWQNVFFINDSTGVIDMAINPLQPDTVYAASWERVRKVDRRSYGGPSSGIYRSIDGGDNWEELTNGLPATAGRIGIAIAESAPEVLYAIYAHETSGNIKGVYKSTDHGNTWNSISYSGVSNVPYMWWFGKIHVDPTNPDIAYIPGFDAHKSIDGGNTWSQIFSGAHVDQHALCVDPLDNNKLILGNDGGLYLSENGGSSHTKSNGLPITQFYTCEIDNSFPERLYGGTQDNGTNRTMTGNLNDWDHIFGGDGFRVLVDPSDNSYVYAESQYGNLGRSINGGSSFTSGTSGISSGDRKNWNTPVAFNPNDPSTLYYGSNRLYKSTNRAAFWSAISPDLTTNPVQNNLTYGTITTISASPINDDIIFVGTDDGNVQVTEDGGSSWALVSSSLPNRWITSVVADFDDENAAYVTLSGFRWGENIGHIYKTTDLGNNWLNVTGDLPDIPINDLIKTPLTGDLFVATDIGVFYSFNEGINWELLGTELPNVVITDIDFHEATNSIIAASFGRGMFKISLDDLTDIADLEDQNKIDLKAYPNPFSEQTTIKFTTEKQHQLVAVSVYNASGVLVKTIYNSQLDQGVHEFKLDAQRFANGIYFCTVKTDNSSIQSELKIIKQ